MRVHPLGRRRAQERAADRRTKAQNHKDRSSVADVGREILRLQMFLGRQRAFESDGQTAYKLVIVNRHLPIVYYAYFIYSILFFVQIIYFYLKKVLFLFFSLFFFLMNK